MSVFRWSGQLPMELKIVSKQLNFLISLKHSSNSLCKFLFQQNSELLQLCEKYNISMPYNNMSKAYVKHVLWNFFADKVDV